jgi:hypothetical protein
MDLNPFHEPVDEYVTTLNEAPWYSRIARRFLAILANFVGRGYGLVPRRWPGWAIKSAVCEEYLAKLSPSASFRAGLHAGRAEAYRRCAAEIQAFQKRA